MQSDIELVITRFSEIEKRLVDDLKAREKNGHVRSTFVERLNQVEHLFSRDSIIRIKSIASLRNKLAHGQLQSIPDKNRFLNDCQLINIAIDAAKRKLLLSQQSESNRYVQNNPNQSSTSGYVFFAIGIGVLSVMVLFVSMANNKANFGSKNNRNNTAIQVSSPVLIKLLKKGVKKGVFNKDDLYCDVKVRNTTDKAITGIKGYCQILDDNNRELHSFFLYLHDDERIKAKSSKTFNLRDGYNQFVEIDRLFKNVEVSKMKPRLRDIEIVYADGTSEKM